MSRLARKFVISISGVLVGVICLSLFLNAKFIERYYLYQKKGEINRICDQILAGSSDIDAAIAYAQKNEDVVIARVRDTNDIDMLNGDLRQAFLDKGLGLGKYWLWDQDYENTIINGRQISLYNQGKLNYSILVEYVYLNPDFLGIAMVLPNVTETIHLINWLTAMIFGGAAVLMILLVSFLVKRITTPLEQIGELAQDISNQNFRQIQIHTHDEMEDLAISINEMSVNLKQSQELLLEKNHQMEALLGNVSHDLKTPVALIKAYTSGIKDGIDDGTFLDTIILQNDKMDKMIESLLNLSRIQQKEYLPEDLDLSYLLNQTLEEQSIAIKEKGITVIAAISQNVHINAGREGVESILSNLVSNAIKYTEDGEMHISLSEEQEQVDFSISNGIRGDISIKAERLWEPFFVLESSRNKELSGTGLGLSIVRAVAQRQGFLYDCVMKEKKITFSIRFKK